MLTLISSPKTDEHGNLFSYQYYTIVFVLITEVIALLLGFSFSLIPQFFHTEKVMHIRHVSKDFSKLLDVGCCLLSRLV